MLCRYTMDQGHGLVHATGNLQLQYSLVYIWLVGLVCEGGVQEGGCCEDGIIPAQPDMVAWVDAQWWNVLLKCCKFYARFAQLVQGVQVTMILLAQITSATDFNAVTVVLKLMMSLQKCAYLSCLYLCRASMFLSKGQVTYDVLKLRNKLKT